MWVIGEGASGLSVTKRKLRACVGVERRLGLVARLWIVNHRVWTKGRLDVGFEALTGQRGCFVSSVFGRL